MNLLRKNAGVVTIQLCPSLTSCPLLVSPWLPVCACLSASCPCCACLSASCPCCACLSASCPCCACLSVSCPCRCCLYHSRVFSCPLVSPCHFPLILSSPRSYPCLSFSLLCLQSVVAVHSFVIIVHSSSQQSQSIWLLNKSHTVRGSQRDVVYLGWPNVLVHEPKCRGGGGLRGLSQWVQLCTWSPNKLWRSNSIFNLCTQYSAMRCDASPFFLTVYVAVYLVWN